MELKYQDKKDLKLFRDWVCLQLPEDGYCKVPIEMMDTLVNVINTALEEVPPSLGSTLQVRMIEEEGSRNGVQPRTIMRVAMERWAPGKPFKIFQDKRKTHRRYKIDMEGIPTSWARRIAQSIREMLGEYEVDAVLEFSRVGSAHRFVIRTPVDAQ